MSESGIVKERRVLVTGAAGFVGRKLIRALARAGIAHLATDLRPHPDWPEDTPFRAADLRDAASLSALFADDAPPTTIVHLASVVEVPPGMTRADVHDIDVGGTSRLLRLALDHGSDHFIVTSSGAAYGYHADNPVPLRESDALRGNEAFSYSAHKREIEQMLADWRTRHPQLQQLVFRPGTILGADVANQITALFAKPRLLGVRGSDSPFVFVWDEDLVALLVAAIADRRTGIYNVCGDGWVTIDDLGRRLGKPVLKLPAGLLRAVLAVLHPLRLSRYGPEQIGFLQYRPVLDNKALRAAFDDVPMRNSRACLESLLDARPELLN